jgi:hypothetical protein
MRTRLSQTISASRPNSGARVILLTRPAVV